MIKFVEGADGRNWTLRGKMSWSEPKTVEDFEHDMTGGQGPTVVFVVVLAVLVVVLLVWRPVQVVIPYGLWVLVLLIALYFPVRWVMRRPWTLVAETAGSAELADRPAERWVGTVRGVFHVRHQVARIVKTIEIHSLPDIAGPLHPMD